MPRFFLHIRDAGEFIEDPDGSELPDLAAARVEATAGAREIVASRVRAGEAIFGPHFDICDGAGLSLSTVSYRDVVRLE